MIVGGRIFLNIDIYFLIIGVENVLFVLKE